MKTIHRLGSVVPFLLTVWVLGMLAPPEAAQAQNATSPAVMGGELSQIKDYGRPGYPRVTVYLWGNGDNGIWMVEKGTDLLEYLSAAADGDFNNSSETKVRNNVLLYRNGQIDKDPVFEASLDDLFSRQVEYPMLQDGDVLVVKSIQKRRFLYRFRTVSQITGAVASVVSLGFLVFD